MTKMAIGTRRCFGQIAEALTGHFSRSVGMLGSCAAAAGRRRPRGSRPDVIVRLEWAEKMDRNTPRQTVGIGPSTMP
jgi:hypothetical protein